MVGESLNTIAFEFTSGPKTGVRIPLRHDTIVFGRSPGSDIVIDWDRLVSSKHFKISKDGGKLVLHDLDSTNGTFLNGDQVSSRELKNGDEVRAGQTLLRIFGQDGIVTKDVSRTTKSPALESALISNSNQSAGKTIENVPSVSQLQLRVVSSIEMDKVCWLRLGQSVTFGRSVRADFGFEFDQILSGEHFQVSFDRDRCEIEDLNSRGGTWLNEKRIVKDVLQHGDLVRAGSLEFIVEMNGMVAVRKEDRPASGQAKTSDRPLSAGRSASVLEMTKSDQPNGLVRLLGQLQDEGSILRIIKAILNEGIPLYFVLDFSRIGLPVPTGIETNECNLFDWLVGEAARKAPWVVSIGELPDWESYVQESWGGDAMIVLQTKLSKQELRARLLSQLKASSDTQKSDQHVQNMVGVCWPSVLGKLLESTLSGFAQRFMEDISIALFEVSGQLDHWQMFGSESIVESTKSIGVRLVQNNPNESIRNSAAARV